jgi:hypothetical protein
MASTTNNVINQVLPVIVAIVLLFFFLETVLGRKLLSDLFALLNSFLVQGATGAAAGQNQNSPSNTNNNPPGNPPGNPPAGGAVYTLALTDTLGALDNGGGAQKQNQNSPSNTNTDTGTNPQNPPTTGKTYGVNLYDIVGIGNTNGAQNTPKSPTTPPTQTTPPNVIVNTITNPPENKSQNNNPPVGNTNYTPPTAANTPIQNTVISGSQIAKLFDPNVAIPNSAVIDTSIQKATQEIATGKTPITQTQPQTQPTQPIQVTTPQNNNPQPANIPSGGTPVIPNPLPTPEQPYGQAALNAILSGIQGIPSYLSNLTKAIPLPFGIPSFSAPVTPIEGIPIVG